MNEEKTKKMFYIYKIYKNTIFICPIIYRDSQATQGEPTARPIRFWTSMTDHYVLTIAAMPTTVLKVSPRKLSLQIDQTRDLLT